MKCNTVKCISINKLGRLNISTASNSAKSLETLDTSSFLSDKRVHVALGTTLVTNPPKLLNKMSGVRGGFRS